MDDNILKRLHNIYTDKGKRDFLINEFQDFVENNTFDDSLEEILVRLSYDLDFYVSNKTQRNEDPSYYGENKLKLNLFNFLLDFIRLRQGNESN